ncbi:SMI1/KNR4 family protein [Soonwooa sp.]|uniref:SMI1/KNR4 family protein n=1 Tax=Soonwooa sp. TaxID=1938592 RepID=UPI0026034ADD|nr:SMI1/KNR4 family protein [Soonwooa sp.]
MTSADKIRRLYDLPKNENFGFKEAEINESEKLLNIKLPLELKNYYLTLGKVEALNYSYNRLLKPNKEIGFSNDRYLVFYEENQVVVYWGIKEVDLKLDNPPVWGNYGAPDEPDWHIETNTIDSFFLLMAVYNGTFGGLKYNANYFGNVQVETVKTIEKNWKIVPEISWAKQKVYTDNFNEVLSLSFDDQNNCNGIFIGTSNQERFDKILDSFEIDWSYTSYEDEDYEEESEN